MNRVSNVDLGITDKTVILRQRGASYVAVANILGTGFRDGRRVIWLDRLIHDKSTIDTEQWQFSGAISTVLTARVPEVTLRHFEVEEKDF